MPTRTAAPKRPLPSVDDATRRVMTQPAVGLADVAALLGVSLATVQRQAAAGTLPVRTVRIGQRWIATSKSVQELLDIEPAPAKVSA